MSDWLQKCSGIWSESYDLCAYVKRVEGRRPFQVQGQTRGSTWAVKYRKCFLLHILSHVFLYVLFPVGFPGSSVAKNLPANARDRGLIPGSGRSPAVGNGNPLKYFCLKSSMDRGAWWATVHRSQRVRHDWSTCMNREGCLSKSQFILVILSVN